MRTGVPQMSRQVRGKTPLRLLQHEQKASSQIGNTDILLHCYSSPPPLDYQTHRLPEKQETII